MRYLSLLSVAFVALVGVQDVVGQQNRPAPTEPMVLSPGDSIRISVWRNPEYTGDFVVAPDGTITHPMFRGVKVAGIPLATAEANVRSFLDREVQKDLPFVMEPLLRVAVLGEVSRPLVFAAQPGTSIAQAIARVGGTSQEGDRRRVRIIRTERSGMQQLLYANLENPEDRLALSPVRSGDQIVVDPRRKFFRDVLMPILGIVGSVASLGLLVDRISRDE